MSDELIVKFWGVRGSYPTPGAGTVRYGGNTASVEIRAGERMIILDAGTGIIPLGRELAGRRTSEIILLLSHLHQDHTQGFPFFLPAYRPGTTLYVFGPDGLHQSLKKVLEQNQSSDTFPVSLREMASSKLIHPVCESHVIAWEENEIHVVQPDTSLSKDALTIRIHRSYAHPGGVYMYRIGWRGKSIVYATDTEGYVGTDTRLVAFAREADLLIHDAQYSDEHYRGALADFPATQGYGHSTVTMACDVAASARVGQLILFHHDPSYSDKMVAKMEAAARKMFPPSQAAYEGLTIRLDTPPASIRSPNGTLRKGQSMDVKYADHG